MKRLIVMRHAKSSWADTGMDDFDRPLNARGKRSAVLMGKWLIQKKMCTPEHAIVSPARRTLQTWNEITQIIGRIPTDETSDLYLADRSTLLNAVANAPSVEAVLILAHQPGIGEFAARLLAQSPSTPEFDRYPTAATAVIDFEASSWKEVTWGTGRLAEFAVPRQLEGAEFGPVSDPKSD